MLLAVLAMKLLPASFELRIGKGDVEAGSGGCLREPLSKEFIAVDTQAGAVVRACKLQERCNGLLSRSFREGQPLAVIANGAARNSVNHNLGRTHAIG